MPIRKPTIVNRGSLSYFFDGDSRRWRVYDSTEEHHHGRPYRQIFSLGDPRASVRCFAPGDKTAAHYVFALVTDADRESTAERLAAQLIAARPFYRRLYYANIPKPTEHAESVEQEGPVGDAEQQSEE